MPDRISLLPTMSAGLFELERVLAQTNDAHTAPGKHAVTELTRLLDSPA